MKVCLRFFSILRERIGVAEKEIEIETPRPASELFAEIFPGEVGKRLLPSTRFAVNCEYVPPEAVVHDGDELAFIPPVSGG